MRVAVKHVRRGLVAVLLSGWLTMLLVSAFTPHIHTCDDEVAQVGNAALVQSCRSLSVTDAPSLAVLVIVGILLLPDLSVLEVLGVLRVERKLEEQTRRQDDIVRMINRLEMSITQRVENTTNIYNEVSSRSERVGELISLQNEKREQFESPAP